MNPKKPSHRGILIGVFCAGKALKRLSKGIINSTFSVRAHIDPGCINKHQEGIAKWYYVCMKF